MAMTDLQKRVEERVTVRCGVDEVAAWVTQFVRGGYDSVRVEVTRLRSLGAGDVVGYCELEAFKVVELVQPVQAP